MTFDPTDLAKAIVDEMKAHGHALGIDAQIHASQHELLEQMIEERRLLIEERREREERRKRIEERIAGSVLLSLIVGIVTLLGSGAMEWLRAHL